MIPCTKKLIQAVTLIGLTTYMTLLVKYLQSNAVVENGGIWRAEETLQQTGTLIKGRELYSDSRGDKNIPNASPYSAENVVNSKNVNKYKKLQSNPNSTELNDIFISVKTSQNFHKSRLDVILKTWFTLAREQTYFFTDGDDPLLQQKTNNHLINTNCSSSHNRKALCCKMSVEFDTFLETNKKWFCHFDDDNYVNIPVLVQTLQGFNPTQDWYLGKPSIRAPLRIVNRDNINGPKISFWFATGGAGFCISRALALKMMSLASVGKFISIGDKIRLPDDVTMGYIIEHLLNHKLTVLEQFHSHLEPMKFIKSETFPDQITFSYSKYGKDLNIVSVDGFDAKIDPTRFLSLHCLLFPNFSFCPR